MKNPMRLWSAALLALALPVNALSAQERIASPETQEAPALALVQTIDTPELRARIFAQSLRELEAALIAGDANVAEMEEMLPGSVGRIVAALAKALDRHYQRISGQFQQDAASLVGQALTAEEVQDAMAFFSSPVGRQLLAAVATNYSTKAMMAEAVAGGEDTPTTPAAINTDLRTTFDAALAEIGLQDAALVRKQFTDSSWGLKLTALWPQIVTARAIMENAAMLPEDEAAMDKAVEVEMQSILEALPQE